jgi:hypothetical protein
VQTRRYFKSPKSLVNLSHKFRAKESTREGAAATTLEGLPHEAFVKHVFMAESSSWDIAIREVSDEKPIGFCDQDLEWAKEEGRADVQGLEKYLSDNSPENPLQRVQIGFLVHNLHAVVVVRPLDEEIDLSKDPILPNNATPITLARGSLPGAVDIIHLRNHSNGTSLILEHDVRWRAIRYDHYCDLYVCIHSLVSMQMSRTHLTADCRRSRFTDDVGFIGHSYPVPMFIATSQPTALHLCTFISSGFSNTFTSATAPSQSKSPS